MLDRVIEPFTRRQQPAKILWTAKNLSVVNLEQAVPYPHRRAQAQTQV